MSDDSVVSYAFGPFRLDPGERVLYRADAPVALTPKAVETLAALVARHGRVVSKEDLFRLVWPDAFVEENNLAQHISLLRKVLGESPAGGPYIETVPRRGYRFVGPVSRVDAGSVVIPVSTRAGETANASEGMAAADPATAGRSGADAPPDAPRPAAGPFPVPTSSRGEGSTRRRAAALALVILAAALLGGFAITRTRDRRADAGRTAGGVVRMAVLPFVNLGAAADDYFVAGMTEEITGRLARVRQLAVASSTTMNGYDRTGKTVPQIGADLGVEYLVEGSVRWARSSAGLQVRITPKLIRVADDTAVWTQQYDAALSDIFGVQADIAYQVAGALQVALERGERRLVDTRPTKDTDAYLAYLRGITSVQQGPSDTIHQAQARTDLEQAVARDPSFAQAWSWLARVYAWQYNTGARRTPETKALARQAAERAIALDARLPEARLGLAQVLLIDRGYAAAQRELDVARGDLPNWPELLRLEALISQRQGHWADSLDAYMRAFDRDPVTTADPLVTHYLHMRDYPEARRFLGILTAANRSVGPIPAGWIHFAERGDIAAARQVLEATLAARPADARARGLLSRFEWFDGRHERALELIEEMDRSGAWLPVNFRFPAALAAGQVYDSMGRRDEAARSYTAARTELADRLRASPDDYQLHAAMGLALAGLGLKEEAIAHGRRAVALLPVSKDAAEGPPYLYRLAEVYARVGEHDAALATLDEMFSGPAFYNEVWVNHDPGFAALRRHARYAETRQRWAARRGDVLLSRDGRDDDRGPAQ